LSDLTVLSPFSPFEFIFREMAVPFFIGGPSAFVSKDLLTDEILVDEPNMKTLANMKTMKQASYTASNSLAKIIHVRMTLT